VRQRGQFLQIVGNAVGTDIYVPADPWKRANLGAKSELESSANERALSADGLGLSMDGHEKNTVEHGK